MLPGDRGHLGERGPVGEPDHAEVRLVDAQDERRVRPDRALVVLRVRPVRRPDLDQPRAGAHEHVRDPEAVADLDQLAARDEHLAALGERGQRQEHRAGVVVDDERRLGSGQAPQRGRQVRLPRPAHALVQRVLEVRVADADLSHPFERRGERAERGQGSCGRSRRSRSARVAGSASARPRSRPRPPPGGRPVRRRRGSRRARDRAPRAPRRRRAGRPASRASSSTEGRSRSSISSSPAPRSPCSARGSSRARS